MRTRATSVVLKDGEILMIHRFNHSEEYWVLPGGGVEDGEDLEVATVRELKEETSIEANLKEKLFEFTDSRGDEHALFLCEYVTGEPKLQSNSVEANSKDIDQTYSPEWVNIEKLPDITIYPKEEKDFLIKFLNSTKDGF